LTDEITRWLTWIRDDKRFKVEHSAVSDALADVTAMVDTMCRWDAASAEAPEQTYRVGQNTTRLLLSVGDLMVGWLLSRQAVLAQARLDDGAGGADADFYAGKVAVARFFTTSVLPELTARRRILEGTDTTLMDVADGAF
jgi:hypothetical protein